MASKRKQIQLLNFEFLYLMNDHIRTDWMVYTMLNLIHSVNFRFNEQK